MTGELANRNTAAAVEAALVRGDLSKMSETERVAYYKAVCDSLGLNPLTEPFAYIVLNGRLKLYARKDAADQLRRVHGISIGEPQIRFEEDWIIAMVTARTADGRADADVGAVNRKDMKGNFGNSLMKAISKAKRRVTLSICGLGVLDETEVETIPGAHPPEPVPALDRPSAVFTMLAELLNQAADQAELADAWKVVNQNKAKLTARELADLAALKDRRKAELAEPPRERQPGEDDDAPF